MSKIRALSSGISFQTLDLVRSIVLSTELVGLVDHTYDGQRVVAGRNASICCGYVVQLFSRSVRKCLCVGRDHEPCKNGRTDRESV